MTPRFMAAFVAILMSGDASADLLGPNPFSDKTTFYPELVAIFERAAKGKAESPTVNKLGGSVQVIGFENASLWVNCKNRTTIKFQYVVSPGDLALTPSEDQTPWVDPTIPKHCQPNPQQTTGNDFLLAQFIPFGKLTQSINAFPLSHQARFTVDGEPRQSINSLIDSIKKAADQNNDIITVVGNVLWESPKAFTDKTENMQLAFPSLILLNIKSSDGNLLFKAEIIN